MDKIGTRILTPDGEATIIDHEIIETASRYVCELDKNPHFYCKVCYFIKEIKKITSTQQQLSASCRTSEEG